MNTLQNIENDTMPKSLLLAPCEAETMFWSSNVSTTSKLPYQYHFGMHKQRRKYKINNMDFGFNGMRNENDWTEGNYDFGARIYDSRSGRWFAVDPLVYKYPDLTSYQFSGNNPLYYKDPNGRVIIGYNDLSSYENLSTTMKIINSSSIITEYLHQFVSPNMGDNLGTNKNGSYSWLTFNFKELDPKINNYANGTALITFKGKDISSYPKEELQGVIASDLVIEISISTRKDLGSGDKLLTVSHEIMLHGSQYANLIIAYKNGEVHAFQQNSKK